MDHDGAFRLGDAAFVAQIWAGNQAWKAAGGRCVRRSLESTCTSDDGVDLLALIERKDAEQQQQQQLERNDADIKELRAKIKELEAALNASVKETLLF